MHSLRDFISALKWPVLAAALVACTLAFLSVQNSRNAAAPKDSEPKVTARVDMREAMRILHDEHDRVLDQADRQRTEAEQKTEEDAFAFDQARLAAQEQARLAAEQETMRKLAEQRAAEQRAAEMKRVVDAALLKETRKPKPEPVVAGAPLDIVPVTGGESGPLVSGPRGPIETVVAKAGDIAGEIKNKAVTTVTDIKDWFAAAGDKLLGRDKAPASGPAGRLAPTSG